MFSRCSFRCVFYPALRLCFVFFCILNIMCMHFDSVFLYKTYLLMTPYKGQFNNTTQNIGCQHNCARVYSCVRAFSRDCVCVRLCACACALPWATPPWWARWGSGTCPPRCGSASHRPSCTSPGPAEVHEGNYEEWKDLEFIPTDNSLHVGILPACSWMIISCISEYI